MKNRQIFIMLTVMMIVLSVVASSYDKFDERKYVPNTSVNTSEKFKENNNAASEAYQKMLDTWEKQDLERNQQPEAYTVDGITAEGYPEYYAGSYINAGGNLVVLLAEDYCKDFLWESAKTKRAKEEMREVTGLSDLIFGTAKHSYRDMIKTKEAIARFKWAKKEEKYRISGAGLDTHGNCINVYIYPLNDDAEKWFRENVVDDPWIVFYERHPDAIEG